MSRQSLSQDRTGSAGGAPVTSILTLGYDPAEGPVMGNPDRTAKYPDGVELVLMGEVAVAVIDDTCGNLIQIHGKE